ncbi:peptidase [Streptomyces sp. NPDC007861]|uniref:peptidase n=1 Tax=Streptomyces sp. NPDC007861 TaxID=3154893 RepID=UPI00340CD969
MKIRRVLATAVAAALTTPVVLLSAAPAFADQKPAVQSEQQQPTIEELKAAVAAAQKAYDEAVIALDERMKAFEALDEETHPLRAAVAEAKKAAEAAATAKAEADQAVVDAQAKVDAVMADPEATDDERVEAARVLGVAQEAAKTAAEAKTAADAKAVEVRTTLDDARVAAARQIHLAQEAKKKAQKELDAAKKALADAEEEAGEEPGPECVAEPKLTTVVTGLPEKVVGGTTVAFTLRVTNGTGKAMDEVYPFVGLRAFDEKGVKELDSHLDLEWSTAANPEWEDVDPMSGPIVGSLKAKSSVDVKLRLKIDAEVPAGQGAVGVAADYYNNDESCGGSPDINEYVFQILTKGSNPGNVDDAEGEPGEPNDPTPQGGTSTPSANGTTGGDGSLAATGSSDVMPQFALASGAALVLGAGAVVVARRRKAGAGA